MAWVEICFSSRLVTGAAGDAGLSRKCDSMLPLSRNIDDQFSNVLPGLELLLRLGKLCQSESLCNEGRDFPGLNALDVDDCL
jgi:hypothetical protein